MPRWYESFAGVPGVEYSPPAEATKAELAGRRKRPTSGSRDVLSWPTRDGSTSQAPASEWAERIEKGGLRSAVKRLYEALELPGELVDYHFAIQSCISRLWRERAHGADLMPDLEGLCWLSVALVEAHPSVIAFPESDTDFLNMEAYQCLVNLRRREGHVREALEIAERGSKLGQRCGVDELRALVDELEAEEEQ